MTTLTDDALPHGERPGEMPELTCLDTGETVRLRPMSAAEINDLFDRYGFMARVEGDRFRRLDGDER